MENTSYMVASKHKLSTFFSLIFRSPTSYHPLLASAVSRLIMQDQGNRLIVGKDENTVRQLIRMINSDNLRLVEQACSSLSNLAGNVYSEMLIRCDIMQPIETILNSPVLEDPVSVLQVMANLAYGSDTVAQKMLTAGVLRSLEKLFHHKNTEVQRLALLAVGNLAFCRENRQLLVTSKCLRELLVCLTSTPEPRVNKAAARALAILGENESLLDAIRGRQVPKQGIRILSLDGGGMKGLATVQILQEIEKGTGKRMHELFDLICGTSTGGIFAAALGKVVFSEPVPKDNKVASWRNKLDRLYRSSSQRFRHNSEKLERLLQDMCVDEDGDDLLIETAVKNIPKVFLVSTLASVTPAQPFVFRNYQYPVGTLEVPLGMSESSETTVPGSPTTGTQLGCKRSAFVGSCKHLLWQAIRASCAAPYYLDDFSDGVYRWLDGALLANNPTIFSIREAQLLWPDTKIDCIVSIGSGSLPTKARKGGWRYLDAGQVLIESACSVDHAEEALRTLLPMHPEIHYFRFNPVDERCGMELDETDPTVWLNLEEATRDYIEKNWESFKIACERLVKNR
ncbi:Phospholipase A I [Hibiscus syriacus]|uniref:Phospholipase A I n=1 Tax=Hibiscus syriacus TaxID=106335 RepID=A0A6A3ANV3_HIBSY|nr:Phospholipase A I [Hibiscus syriacus]